MKPLYHIGRQSLALLRFLKFVIMLKRRINIEEFMEKIEYLAAIKILTKQTIMNAMSLVSTTL